MKNNRDELATTVLWLVVLVSLACAIGGMISGCSLSRSVKDIYRESQDSIVLVNTELGHCSGFVLTPTPDEFLVVTAGHCVDSPTSITSLEVVVDGVRYQFTDYDILADDDKKDLAVISVPGLENLYFYGLVLDANIPQIGERLIDLGFPFFSQGEIQFDIGHFKGSLEDSEKTLLLADNIGFRGYSGSPVLNEKGFVVGVLVGTASRIDFFNPLNPLNHQHKDLSYIVSAKDLVSVLETIER